MNVKIVKLIRNLSNLFKTCQTYLKLVTYLLQYL